MTTDERAAVDALATELGVVPTEHVVGVALEGEDGRMYGWVELVLAHVRLLRSAESKLAKSGGPRPRTTKTPPERSLYRPDQ
jgi:hypothetical protein